MIWSKPRSSIRSTSKMRTQEVLKSNILQVNFITLWLQNITYRPASQSEPFEVRRRQALWRTVQTTISFEFWIKLPLDFNLKSWMIDAGFLSETDASLQRGGTVLRLGDHHMRSAQDRLGTHRPKVDVVHLCHVWDSLQLFRQVRLVDAFWRFCHQSRYRSCHWRLRCVQHKDAEQKSARWVSVIPPADSVRRHTNVEGLQPDTQRSNCNAYGLNDVPDGMSDCSLHGSALLRTMRVAVIVSSMAVTVTQNLRKDYVHDHSKDGDDEHDFSMNFLQMHTAIHRFVHEDGRQSPHDHD
mmetsp:Transcript_118/g.403  ORF Transcript_118/g.403 Transcript_118/m.403 type:complete len:297 (-) Transcript_118:638-1528(-)